MNIQYDSAGRLTTKVVQFGNNASSTGDGANRVTQVTCGGNVITTVVTLQGVEVARTRCTTGMRPMAIEQIQTIQCATPGAGWGWRAT